MLMIISLDFLWVSLQIRQNAPSNAKAVTPPNFSACTDRPALVALLWEAGEVVDAVDADVGVEVEPDGLDDGIEVVEFWLEDGAGPLPTIGGDESTAFPHSLAFSNPSAHNSVQEESLSINQ